MDFDLYIDNEDIIAGLEIYDKKSAIASMVNHVNKSSHFDNEEVVKLLIAREEKKSSGCGKGIAILHSISSMVPQLSICIATFKYAVDWNSIDKKPVKIAALILAPSRYIADYLEIIERICQILANEMTKTSLMNMQTPAQMITVLRAAKGFS